MKRVIISSFVLFLVVFVSCSKDSDAVSSNDDGFDRTLLTNAWVNNLWLPALNDLASNLNELEEAVNTFNTTVSTDNLEVVREKWLSAYKIWQHVHIFSFGVSNVSSDTNFAADMNSFPVDVNQIEVNVIAENEIPITFTRHDDAQGFPAIDYLINGLASTDTEIVNKLKSTNYQNYLLFLVNRMQTLVKEQLEVTNAINLNNVGNDANSFFSLQINDILQYTEKAFREAKIATPSGTRQRLRKQFQIDANVNILPKANAVEARFSSENSKLLYLEAYDAIQDVYFGRKYSDNTKITGIQDYLQFLGTTILVENVGDMLLDEYIVTLFDDINTANNNLTDNFFEQTQDYNTNFDTAFDAIQEYIVAFKGNTLSAFNITIDFADNDGD